MNRNDEMNALLMELEETPAALEYTLTRAKARGKRRAFGRIFAPLGSLCTLVLVFVLMINLSPTFADACSGIPLIGQLVSSLKHNPSLQVAIENDYFQPMEEEQTQNGVTCRMLGVIVDRKQLNIFYTLDSREYDDLGSDIQLLTLEGQDFNGISSGGAWRAGEDGIIRKRADFFENDMPQGAIFRIQAMENSDTPVAEFEFTLTFDPYFTSHGEVLAVDRDFTMDGNSFTVDTIEIYPTQMRINLSSHEDNPAWLKGLDFTVTDEEGNEFSSIRNGISAVGDPDTGEYTALMLESPYFYTGGSLTLNITGAQWLGKDAPAATIDLDTGKAESLPPDVEFLNVERNGNSCTLVFKVKSRGGSSDYNFHNVFGHTLTDESGKEYDIRSFGSSMSWLDPATEEYIEEPGWFSEELYLDFIPTGKVELEAHYSHETTLDTPISIELK